MNEQIKVSVIVPVFNAEKFLKDCIDSILAQSLKEIELILVDDGSTDKSPFICDSYLDDLRVKVIHKKNSGPSEARNAGIDKARGEYIGFVDADDTVDKDMFKTLYSKASGENADLAFCDFTAVKGNEKKAVKSDLSGERVYEKKEIEKEILPYFFGYADNETKNYKGFFPFADYASYIWLCIFKKSLLNSNSIRFMNQKKYFNEDNLFNMEFVFFSDKLVHTDICLYNYRDSGNSLTKRYDANFLNAKVNRYKFLYEFIEKNSLGKDYEQRLINKVSVESLNIINYYINAVGIGFKEKYKKAKETVKNPIIKDAVKKVKLRYIGFSMLSVYLFFEKLHMTPVLYLLSNAYNLIR